MWQVADPRAACFCTEGTESEGQRISLIGQLVPTLVGTHGLTGKPTINFGCHHGADTGHLMRGSGSYLRLPQRDSQSRK